MGRPFELLTLSEGERVELGALAPAARRHRPWRFAPGSSSCRVTGSPTRMWRRGWVSIRSRLANGGGASWKAVPVDLDVHLVMDTYATHKTPLIRDWLLKRPRWPVHHTPTGASWINQVERFFALLSERQIKRGAHRSVGALQAAITTCVDAHNADPTPFRWTKSADDILATVERFCLRVTPAEMTRTSSSGH